MEEHHTNSRAPVFGVHYADLTPEQKSEYRRVITKGRRVIVKKPKGSDPLFERYQEILLKLEMES